MSEPIGRAGGRREFFRGVLRSAGLLLLGAAGGAAAAKRRRLVREGRCANRGVCSGCDDFDGCGLPRALSTKRAAARTQDGR